MARFARVIALDTPHHITQRGNAQRFILDSDSDRLVYLQLLSENCRLHGLSLAGYCLMSNHVHLIGIPRYPESLALALKHTHGRYAAYFNARHQSSGHVWQGRYYSCPLDGKHFWAALRYIEMNPVRAGLTNAPQEYAWSSAAAHCGAEREDRILDLALWRETWRPAEWAQFLSAAPDTEPAEIRRSTHTGRPMGSPEFVRSLEHQLKRRLVPARGGRPPKQTPDVCQQAFAFGQK